MAMYPSLVKGEGLKTSCDSLRGFESRHCQLGGGGLLTKRAGEAQRLAYRAHNPEGGGSTPPLVKMCDRRTRVH